MNIFQLSAELQDIFNELEENGGELTPELEKRLQINQADVNDKVETYTKVIAQLNSDIELIKNERKRLDDLKKRKENTIERIKKLILYAIDMFGTTNKSGSKYIDFGTGKVSTRLSESIEIDDEGYENLCETFRKCLYVAGYLNAPYQIDDLDLKSLVDSANIKVTEDNKVNDNYAPVSINDLDNLTFNVIIPIKATDIHKREKTTEFLKSLAHNYYNSVKVAPSIDKTLLKADLISDEPKQHNLSKLINKTNVIIK